MSDPSSWQTQNLSDPDRVRVYDGYGLVATFTRGARSVLVRGAERAFAESTTMAVVRHAWQVRMLPEAFNGTVDQTWLGAALNDPAPDVLAVGMEYVAGGTLDADYGPVQADGTRQEGSDWNDYLQVTHTYPDGTVDRPEPDQDGCLDCSGYVRMVFGHRFGYPMCLSPDDTRLPRRSVDMAARGPGVVIVPNTGARPNSAAIDRLAPGDLLFWDASTDDGTAVDHVGIYLGKDSLGAPRFLSSRKTVNGPTMGDVGGKSLLSGTGLYATTWRSARRL